MNNNAFTPHDHQLEKSIGPALKFADKDGGIALTTIELANLDDEENELDDTV